MKKIKYIILIIICIMNFTFTSRAEEMEPSLILCSELRKEINPVSIVYQDEKGQVVEENGILKGTSDKMAILLYPCEDINDCHTTENKVLLPCEDIMEVYRYEKGVLDKAGNFSQGCLVGILAGVAAIAVLGLISP